MTDNFCKEFSFAAGKYIMKIKDQAPLIQQLSICQFYHVIYKMSIQKPLHSVI